MRYTDSCRPVFPGNLLPKKVGGRKKRKNRRSKSPVINGGDGYSVMPGEPIGGQPGVMRYTDSCRPVFPGNLLPKKVGGSKKRKNRRGIISSLVSGDIKLKSGNIRNMSKECNDCAYTIAKGGALVGQAVHGLADIIFPMSKNSLIALIVLLFSNHLVSKRKVTRKQMGGNLGDYLKIFVPMTKNNFSCFSICFINSLFC